MCGETPHYEIESRYEESFIQREEYAAISAVLMVKGHNRANFVKVLHWCSQKTTNTRVLSHAHDKWCYRTFSGECSWCIHVYRFILRCYKLLAKVLSVKQLLHFPDQIELKEW